MSFRELVLFVESVSDSTTLFIVSTIDTNSGELSRVKDPLQQFRIVAIAEAVSYLLLLGVAMPLKYYFELPLAVRIVGSIHGGLFVLYLIAVFRAAQFGKWTPLKVGLAIVASLLPFAPFFVEGQSKPQMQPNQSAID
jgi:integral membrane protein